jgi:H+/Cl- antiporter ClcA
MLLPLLVPGVVAAAVGYLLFVGLGEWGGLPTASLAVPNLPDYDNTRVLDLLLAVVVGVLAALLISHVRKLATVLDRLSSAPGRMLPWLLAGGLSVGLLGVLVEQTGVDIDQLMFSGQSGVPLVIDDSVPVLLAVVAAKALAYGITLGCGFRGGPIFPAIFLGVAIATFAVAIFDSSVTWAVAVGAAAGMAAGSGLLFSSLLFSALLVGSPGIDVMPCSVFAAVGAWLTSAALSGHLPGRQPDATTGTPAPGPPAAT